MKTKPTTLDDAETIYTHGKIIQNNKLLYSTYLDFYKRLRTHVQKGPVVEIGSGAGFIKKIIPETITTDVIKEPGIDKIAFAEKLPFKNFSIGTILMLNTFHHIKNSEKALKEFDRVLMSQGRIVMIEPCNSAWAKFVYTFLHHEKFNTKAGWKISGRGRLSDANGALPWIVFVRDKKIFNKKFPNLKIKLIDYHTPLTYLLSGGLSQFQVLRNLNFKIIKKMENFLNKFSKIISMFMTIVIEKK